MSLRRSGEQADGRSRLEENTEAMIACPSSTETRDDKGGTEIDRRRPEQSGGQTDRWGSQRASSVFVLSAASSLLALYARSTR